MSLNAMVQSRPSGKDTSADGTQYCGVGTKAGSAFCYGADVTAQRNIVQVLGVHLDRRGAMVELMNHTSNVERYPVAGRTAETVAADGIRAFTLLKLCARAEQAGVVGHVEHPGVSHRPRLHRLARRAVHQHRQAPVDHRGQLGVAAGAEDRRGAGVGIDAGKALRRQRETTLGVVTLGDILKEEGATRGAGEPRRAGDE